MKFSLFTSCKPSLLKLCNRISKGLKMICITWTGMIRKPEETEERSLLRRQHVVLLLTWPTFTLSFYAFFLIIRIFFLFLFFSRGFRSCDILFVCTMLFIYLQVKWVCHGMILKSHICEWTNTFLDCYTWSASLILCWLFKRYDKFQNTVPQSRCKRSRMMNKSTNHCRIAYSSVLDPACARVGWL